MKMFPLGGCATCGVNEEVRPGCRLCRECLVIATVIYEAVRRDEHRARGGSDADYHIVDPEARWPIDSNGVGPFGWRSDPRAAVGVPCRVCRNQPEARTGLRMCRSCLELAAGLVNGGATKNPLPGEASQVPENTPAGQTPTDPTQNVPFASAATDLARAEQLFSMKGSDVARLYPGCLEWCRAWAVRENIIGASSEVILQGYRRYAIEVEGYKDSEAPPSAGDVHGPFPADPANCSSCKSGIPRFIGRDDAGAVVDIVHAIEPEKFATGGMMWQQQCTASPTYPAAEISAADLAFLEIGIPETVTEIILAQATFNHTRGDSPATPCPICAKAMGAALGREMGRIAVAAAEEAEATCPACGHRLESHITTSAGALHCWCGCKSISRVVAADEIKPGQLVGGKPIT